MAVRIGVEKNPGNLIWPSLAWPSLTSPKTCHTRAKFEKAGLSRLTWKLLSYDKIGTCQLTSYMRLLVDRLLRGTLNPSAMLSCALGPKESRAFNVADVFT